MITIITEGGGFKGFGHLSRTVALYQEFSSRGFSPHSKNSEKKLNFFVNNNSEAHYFLKIHGVKFIVYESEDELLKTVSSPDKNSDFQGITIVDSYTLSERFYSAVFETSRGCAFFDDTMRLSYPPGVIINGALNAPSYPQKEGHYYLTGINYFAIRRGFVSLSPITLKPEISNIVITLRGSYARPVLSKILLKLSSFPYRFFVFDRPDTNFSSNLPGKLIFYDSWLSDAEIAKIFASSDLAITGGGQSSYELLYFGIPSIGVCLADNQEKSLENLASAGSMLYAGWHDDASITDNILSFFESLKSFEIRKKLHEKAKSLIDGKGAKRICDFLLKKFEQ